MGDKAPQIGKHIKLSEPWELIRSDDGSLYMGYDHGPDRYVVRIGETDLLDHELEGAMTFIRTAGESFKPLN